MNVLSHNQHLILVEVRAKWSGGSHLMDLIVNKLEEQFQTQLRVVRLDFETYRELLIHFGVEGAPAILFIKIFSWPLCIPFESTKISFSAPDSFTYNLDLKMGSPSESLCP